MDSFLIKVDKRSDSGYTATYTRSYYDDLKLILSKDAQIPVKGRGLCIFFLPVPFVLPASFQDEGCG